MVGDNWPYNGEYDIVESVNNARENHITPHTGPNCQFKGVARDQSGVILSDNCDIGATGNQACGTKVTQLNNYGQGFNDNGGGVYATLWDLEKGFKTWFFPRNAIPIDIQEKNPLPEQWGRPAAHYPFGSHCTSDHFKEMLIVINLTFCGDWAGATFKQDGCDARISCEDFVRKNPFAFQNAKWDINSIRIYQPTPLAARAVEPAVQTK